MQIISPLSQRFRLSIIGVLQCSPLVAKLLFLRCPPAILGAVSGVVVLSIYGMLCGRSLSHIREKVLKLEPSIADADTASEVVSERMMRFGRGSAFHCTPSSICRSMPSRSRSTVGDVTLANQASATSSFAFDQFCAIDDFFFPALAPAEPVSVFVHVGDRECRKSSKSTAREIVDFSCHPAMVTTNPQFATLNFA